MSDTSSRLMRTLRDLVLALLNATLILLAVCLFLGLRLAGTVDSITNDVAQNFARITPLRDEVQEMTDQIAGLRADLAAVRAQSGELTSGAAAALTTRIETFDAQLATVQGRMDEVRGKVSDAAVNPKALIDHAIQAATNQAALSVADLAGCTLPEFPNTDVALPEAETKP